MRTFLLSMLLVLSISFSAFASHVPGGQITYECIGPNQYQITLTLFEDCGTAFTGTTPETINISNDCGLVNPPSLSAAQTVYQQEVSQLCPTAVSECDGGPYPGVWMHQYTAIVTLPGPCDSWHFSYSSCCRNTATNASVFGGDAYYWEATLNNADAPCNNSPTFAAAPIPYVCVGSPVCYSFGVIETDGDSISFAFVNALSASGTSITYAAGYTGAMPIPGITIDPVTGQINFTPTMAGNYIVAVQITEYDAAGNIIGTIIRDIQFEVINCTNDIVDCSTAGTIPSTSIIGAVLQTGPTTLEMCEGIPFCFTVTFTDPDPADILTLTSNVSLVLPGATIVTTSGNTATAQICWTPPAGSASAYTSFSITVADNACPVSGQQTIVYTMDVLGGTVASPDMTICGTQAANLTAAGGTIFNWTAVPGGDPIVVGTNFSCNPCANPVATPSVTTTYVVTSNLSGTCDNVDTVTVNVVPDFQFSVSQSSPTSCLLSDVFIATTITGGTGTGPFTYEWTPSAGLSSPSIPNPVFTASVPGAYNYVLEVQNASGCTYTDTVQISVAPSYAPDVTALASLDTIFCGDLVQLTVDLGGGIPATCGLSSTGACAGPVSNVQIGTFTTQNTTTSYPTPFGNWYANEKQQYLYTAAELNAMGFIGGKINSIGFNVISTGGLITYPSYTVKMACTGLTSLPSTYGSPFATPSFSTVYGPMNKTVTTGLNTINFTTPYDWDGVSNILVEICYNWTAMYSFTSNCVVQLTNTPFTSSTLFNSDGTPACPNPSLNSGYNTRPVTHFNYCPAEPDSNAFSYAWTPVATVTTPGSMTTTADPCMSTTYQVVVTDLAGGCTDTATVFVYVEPTCFPPIPTITNVDCNGASTGAISAQMVGTTGPWVVQWSQGATVLATHTGITSTDSLTGLPAGTYTVTITDTSGCTDDTIVTITEPLPVLLDASADDSICISENFIFSALATGGTGPYTYVWSGDFVGASPGPNTVTPPSDQVYIVNATDANGCAADDDTVFVWLYPGLIAATSGDQQICMGSTATITSGVVGGIGSPYSFTWYEQGNPAPIATGSLLTVTPTVNGTTYFVVASDGCGTPDDTAYATVTFFPEPYPSFTVDTTVGCVPVEITFTNTTSQGLIQTVNWDFGDGTLLSDASPTVTHVYGTPNVDCYDVYIEVISPDGCAHDTTYNDLVCVLGFPTANFTYSPQPVDILATEVSFDNYSSPDVVAYQWVFYDSLNNILGSSTAAEPVFEFPDQNPGTYPVLLVVQNNNGCIDSVMLNVIIGDIFTLYIPNAFSPDGNGFNELFMPIGNNFDMAEYEFTIFDRWGQTVFRTTDITQGWDGNMNNIKCKSDVYVWQIKVKSALNGQRVTRTGHVTLLR